MLVNRASENRYEFLLIFPSLFRAGMQLYILLKTSAFYFNSSMYLHPPTISAIKRISDLELSQYQNHKTKTLFSDLLQIRNSTLVRLKVTVKILLLFNCDGNVK